MARYLRPPNTSLFVRNIADESRYVELSKHGAANVMLHVLNVQTDVNVITVAPAGGGGGRKGSGG